MAKKNGNEGWEALAGKTPSRQTAWTPEMKLYGAQKSAIDELLKNGETIIGHGEGDTPEEKALHDNYERLMKQQEVQGQTKSLKR